MSRRFSLSAFGVAVMAFVVSDLVNREYDPVGETLSRYVNLPHGWLVTVALLAVSAGSAALTMRTAAGWGRWLLGAWAACVLVAAVFPADAPGNWANPSLSDTVHGVAAWAGLLALAVAIVRLSVTWRSPGLTVLAWLASVAFALFAVAMADMMAGTHTAPLGLAERLLIGLDLAWLALAAHEIARPVRGGMPDSSGTLSGMSAGNAP